MENKEKNNETKGKFKINKFHLQGAIATLLIVAVIFGVMSLIPDVSLINISGDELSGTMLKTSSGSEPTYVGYGIDVLKGSTFADGLKSSVLMSEVYVIEDGKDDNEYIDILGINTADGSSVISENLTDMYTKLDISTKLETGEAVPFFSGNFSTQYGKSQELKKESKLYNSIFSATTNKHSINGDYKATGDFVDIVSKKVMANINSNISPNELFNHYGTHIILSAGIGGSVNVSGLYNSSEKTTDKDMEVALDFQSKWISGESTTKMNEKQKKIRKETKINTYARGGDVGIFTGANLDNLSDKLENWGDSIAKDTSKLTIANIYEALPIWELAENSERKKELKKYFDDSTKSINNVLSNHFTINRMPEDGGTYQITNWKENRMSLDLEKYAGKPYLVAYGNRNHAGQKWKLKKSDSKPNHYTFESVHMKKYMDVYSNDYLYVNSMSSVDSQLFEVVENEDGSFLILGKSKEKKTKNKRLRVAKTGKNWIELTTNTGDETKWKFVKVD